MHTRIFQHLLIVLGTGLLAWLAFGQAIHYGFAPIDDGFLIADNLAIRAISWENIKTIFTSFDPELYIPFTLLSFQLEHALFGLNPVVMHIVNLLLHTANALLLMALLTRLTGRRNASIAAGLIFAVHPIFTTDIVWLTSRKDLLSTFFALSAWISYLRWNDQSAKRWYLASIILFLCALLSKVTPAPLPMAIFLGQLLIDRRKDIKQFLKELAPLFALSMLFIVIAFFGKTAVVSSLGPLHAMMLGASNILFIAWKFVLPTGLAVYHPWSGELSMSNPTLWIPFLIFILLIAAIAWFVRKEWRTEGMWSVGILTYLLFLIPTSFNLQTGDLILKGVERYAYLPSIGLFFLLTLLLSRIQSWKILSGVAAIILAILVPIARVQTATWQSPVTLFERVLSVHPEAVQPRIHLATILRQNRQYQEAFDLLREGLEHGDHPLLHLHAGYVFAATGQIADAREQLQIARQMNPDHAETIFASGDLEMKTGNPQAAKPFFKEALALDPSYVIARTTLARILLQEGNATEAEEQLRTALEWNMNSYEANALLGELLQGKGETEEAQIYLERAKKLEKY